MSRATTGPLVAREIQLIGYLGLDKKCSHGGIVSRTVRQTVLQCEHFVLSVWVVTIAQAYTFF
jgi:hypothetical protein